MTESKYQDGANNFPQGRRRLPVLFGENIVAIYTILSVLRIMKQQLGLEAMLEYINIYLSIIEKNNPFLRKAVGEALQLISVEKLYRDMTKDEKSN